MQGSALMQYDDGRAARCAAMSARAQHQLPASRAVRPRPRSPRRARRAWIGLRDVSGLGTDWRWDAAASKLMQLARRATAGGGAGVQRQAAVGAARRRAAVVRGPGRALPAARARGATPSCRRASATAKYDADGRRRRTRPTARRSTSTCARGARARRAIARPVAHPWDRLRAATTRTCACARASCPRQAPRTKLGVATNSAPIVTFGDGADGFAVDEDALDAPLPALIVTDPDADDALHAAIEVTLAERHGGRLEVQTVSTAAVKRDDGGDDGEARGCRRPSCRSTRRAGYRRASTSRTRPTRSTGAGRACSAAFFTLALDFSGLGLVGRDGEPVGRSARNRVRRARGHGRGPEPGRRLPHGRRRRRRRRARGRHAPRQRAQPARVRRPRHGRARASWRSSTRCPTSARSG